MTYTLTLCLGTFLGLCGMYREVDYQSKAECLEARAQVPAKSIGDGYALCKPKEIKK